MWVAGGGCEVDGEDEGVDFEVVRRGCGISSLSESVGFCNSTLSLRRIEQGAASSFVVICLDGSSDSFRLRLA